MENLERSLNNQQAWVSAPKIKENNNMESKCSEELEAQKEKDAALRFGGLSIGCFIYAIIYTFCMYENRESITFPFFVGATLYFFYYFTKKYYGTVPKNNRFLVVSMVILGLITCTTASTVIIQWNKLLILILLCVLLLKTYHDVSGWNVPKYLGSICYLVGGSLIQMFTPISDAASFYRYRQEREGKKEISDQTKQRIFAIAAGFVIAIPMVLAVSLLLCGADVVFREAFGDVLDFIFDREWDFLEVISDTVKICLTVLVFFLLSYGVLVYSRKKTGIEGFVQQKMTQWDSFVAITFCSLIGIIYVLFVWVQIAGLFMGKLELPYGYTYAEYARQGFFQLVFVCIFNACLVLVCISCFKKHRILQILLTIISGCTYVMLVSSAYRMFMYIREYHLTFLRFLVLWGIVVIAVVMAGVIVAIYMDKFPLFSYMLVSITSLYILFAAIHPDYVIARYNVAQRELGRKIDEWYLIDDLSLDAAGVVFEMLEQDANSAKDLAEATEGDNNTQNVANWYYEHVTTQTQDMGIRSFNFSKGIAGWKAEQFQENIK